MNQEPSPAPMTRPANPQADALIGKRLPVLDHGFVCLVDYMGNDAAIVQAARVSYGAGTKTSRSDRGLIRYLLRHRHTTPFEMVECKFLMRLPVFVARQIIRHRTANVNEYSARYSLLLDEFYIPPLEAIRAQSKVNRQGREDPLPAGVAEEYQRRLADFSRTSYELYSWASENQVARELARLCLPVNVYTEWYWKLDLHNLFHFLRLRLDPHAQEETRAYARAVAEITKTVAPVAYEAFTDFTLEEERLSRYDRLAIKGILSGLSPEQAATSAGMETKGPGGEPLKSGEYVEFLQKLDRISSPL